MPNTLYRYIMIYKHTYLYIIIYLYIIKYKINNKTIQKTNKHKIMTHDKNMTHTTKHLSISKKTEYHLSILTMT